MVVVLDHDLAVLNSGWVLKQVAVIHFLQKYAICPYTLSACPLLN